jgi:flagellar biosynthetic protein FliO
VSVIALVAGTVPAEQLPPLTGGIRAVAGILLVLGIVCALAWMARRGLLRLPGARSRVPMSIDSALPLGERRSLVVVSIEGRRLLLGLTPASVSFVTELAPPSVTDFQNAVDRHVAPSVSGS